MHLDKLLTFMCVNKWQYLSTCSMVVCQILLWTGLVYLHVILQREEAPWKECVGKIRSAYLRKVNGEEELSELRVHNYSPLVNKLIALNFAQYNKSITERSLLLCSKTRKELFFYLIYWCYLMIGFFIAIWLMLDFTIYADLESLRFTVFDPRLLLLWLGYAIILVRKQIFIWIGLERIKQSLLIPQYDE